MPPQEEQSCEPESSSSLSLSEPLLLASQDDDDDHITTETTHQIPVSRNVKIILVYTWITFTGRGTWNQNVLATLIFLLRSGDPKAVGFITAAMGLSQLLISLPTGYLADKYRRDTLLRVAAVLGVAAVATTCFTALHASYQLLVLSLCICINAAIYQTSDIKTIKANEKAYFEAQPVNVNPFKLILGSVFSAEVSTSDQPGKPVTATFETIGKYLQKYDAGSEVMILTPEQ